MNSPYIATLNYKDNKLKSLLEKEGLCVVELHSIDELREKILSCNIAIVLIEEVNKWMASSVHKFLLQVSPDTKIIIFGSGSKEPGPYPGYRHLRWPSKDKASVLQVIKNTILEYLLFRRERLSAREALFENKIYKKEDRVLGNDDTLEVLRSLNIELSSCKDSKEAIHITKEYIERIFKLYCYCFVLRLNKHFEILAFDVKECEKNLLKKIVRNLIVVNGILMQSSTIEKEIESIYINGEKSNIEINIKLSELCEPIEGIGSHVIFPVIAGGENFGCIAIYSKKRTAFGIDDIRKLSVIAYQLANILLNIKVISRIRDISIKDALTDLYNRRYFDEILQHEYLRAKRYYFPLSLIMIDIDYFKSVNDTFGHLIGDKVLNELAKLIKDSVRQVDIVARFGGEEFAIILLNTPLEEAANMAERLRNIVQKHIITVDGHRVNITVSGGISSLRKGTFSKDELVEQADKALLKAKASGRNKVYMYIGEKEIREVKTEGPRERRRFKRIVTELSINYIPLTIHSINPGEAVSKDISEGGISFADVHEIPKGEFLLLDFDIPVRLGKKHHIKALAQVVWNKKEGDRIIMGAKLITLDPGDKAILRNLSVHNEMLM